MQFNSLSSLFRAWLLDGVLQQQALVLVKLETLMTTVAELGPKLNKIQQTLVKAIDEIKAALADQPLDPQTEDALARLDQVATALDDLNPDTPPPAE